MEKISRKGLVAEAGFGPTYIVVSATPPGAEPLAAAEAPGSAGVRYTKPLLKNALQLMGCKPRHAEQVSETVFQTLQARWCRCGSCGSRDGQQSAGDKATVHVSRACFEAAVAAPLADLKYDRPQHLAEFQVACSVREQRSSVTVLLCGTSGTGKSTLGSLLAARLGITTVLSTDSIRHMMRSFASPQANPLLWVSTYQAGDCLEDPALEALRFKTGRARDRKERTIKGYKAQSEMVMEHLDRLIGGAEARHESLLVEGVHLSLNFVVRLMQRHPTIIPFLIHISNENKHRERFAVRAKYMTLDPAANRYIQYIRAIRTIQDYLVRRADKHLIPKVDNTNVDRSVATIHATVIACLRRQAKGEALLEAGSMCCKVVQSEYLQCRGATWSSKDMLQLIRRKAQLGARHSTDSAGPSTSTSTPLAPRSEVEGMAAEEDAHSFFDVAESDMASTVDYSSSHSSDDEQDDDDGSSNIAAMGSLEGGYLGARHMSADVGSVAESVTDLEESGAEGLAEGYSAEEVQSHRAVAALISSPA